MGEDHRPSFTQLPLSPQSPELNSTTDSTGVSLNTCDFNMISSQEGLPINVFPTLPNSRIGRFNQPQGWFYCSPRFHQAFTPGPIYSALQEKLPNNHGNFDLNAEKKYLVFDQSGDKTTVMVSSGPGTPFRCMTSWTLKQPMRPDMDNEAYGPRPGSFPVSKLMSRNDHVDNYEDADVSSEMHEDTEELNALLCSDDEGESYYSEEDDEVASTGHSPSVMTTHERTGHFQRHDNEEVASPAWPQKRKWMQNDVEVLIDDTASSGDIEVQSHYLSKDDDDASSYAERGNSGFHKVGLSSSKTKRMRMEKVRETMELLQEMIPEGKGKDALAVLDGAIDYLKSLKVRAQALGLAVL